MHGDGTLVTGTIKYVGQFSKGQQDGKGLQVWWKDDGDSYEGRFHGSRPHGLGVYKFASRGESYVGYMENGIMSGEGTYTYSDGSIYEGQWQAGKQHGQGRLTYKDGTAYQGQFKDDAFDGQGAFVESNGSIFAGTFERDKRCGEVAVMHADGQRELRRYDSGGQEIERKLQPRVQPNRSKNAQMSMFGRAGQKGSIVSCLPELHSPGHSPRAPFALPGIAGGGKRGILPVVSAR